MRNEPLVMSGGKKHTKSYSIDGIKSDLIIYYDIMDTSKLDKLLKNDNKISDVITIFIVITVSTLALCIPV